MCMTQRSHRKGSRLFQRCNNGHWRQSNDGAQKKLAGAYPAFVAHADVVKLLIAHYTGLPVERASSLFIDNASVSLVEIDPENIHSMRMIGIGWSPHPGWLSSLAEKAKKHDTESDIVHDKAEQKI